jgi:hypothetical protein
VEDENYVQMLLGNPEGTRPLGRLELRWEDNIKIVLSEIEQEGELDSSASGSAPVAAPYEHGHISGSIKDGECLD